MCFAALNSAADIAEVPKVAIDLLLQVETGVNSVESNLGKEFQKPVNSVREFAEAARD